MQEWVQWRKSGARPANIPAAPEQVYKYEGWLSWGHWLGTITAPMRHSETKAAKIPVRRKSQFLPHAQVTGPSATNPIIIRWFLIQIA